MTDNPTHFIDFEASSLDLVASYPIEVGVCLGSGETKSWLIKPHVVWKDWSERAFRIHGIKRDTLESDGLDVGQVAEELNAFLSGEVYCDAWTFDSFWLHRLYKAAGLKPSFNLESIATLLSDKQVAQWQHMHKEVIRDLELDRHRAENDAIILHETWSRLKSYPDR